MLTCSQSEPPRLLQCCDGLVAQTDIEEQRAEQRPRSGAPLVERARAAKEHDRAPRLAFDAELARSEDKLLDRIPARGQM
jgi:hypothetical protein